ncbi:hypothetical protein BsWGS_26030 [Bradybaena similaris]
MDNFTNICEATSQSHELDTYKPTHRKGKKLLAEKKRRARINNCLLQIRNIVCEGEDDKDTDLEKMEKAEILEKTLEVLTRLRHDYTSPGNSSYSTRKAMAVRYASGFSSCAEESIRYIQNSHLVPAEVKVQLQAHLRAIARRMEAGLQEDSKDVSFTQTYPTSPSLSSPSSSSMFSGRLTTALESKEDIYRSDISRGQMSDIGSYTPSPIHFSTPTVQPHMPVSSTVSQPNQEEYLSQTPQTFMKAEFSQKESKPREYIPSDMVNFQPQNICLNKDIHSSYSISTYSHPEVSSTGSEQDSQYNTALLSPNTSYSLSNPSINDTTLSGNTPIILYPAPVLQTTSLISDPPVFSYVYESYPSCTVPSILVQPVTYISTPIRQTPVGPTAHKQSSTPNNALDLCVKRNEVHQISPETMWRPW